MGGVIRAVSSIFGGGGGDNFDEIAAQMRQDAEERARQAREDAARQAQQQRESMASQQRQYEQSLQQQAAQEQARRAEQEAQQKQGTVEVGATDQPVQNDEETRRRRDPRSQYMAPTGAYTALKL